jgi:hypothetical protein
MDAATQVAAPSKVQKWMGNVLSTLVVLFLLMDSVMKLLKLPIVLDASAKLGFSASVIFTIGVILLFCVILYVIPQTSILGAILLTGYLGGAVCTHLRLGNPLFSHILFPTYLGALLWLGLYLREPRLRTLVPFRS